VPHSLGNTCTLLGLQVLANSSEDDLVVVVVEEERGDGQSGLLERLTLVNWLAD